MQLFSDARGHMHLDKLHAAEALLGDASNQLVCFPRQQPAGLRPASTGDKRGVERIDIIYIRGDEKGHVRT